MQKIKHKTEQYFFQNYLQFKHKHSKSFTKHMSKSELWKKKTAWRLWNTCNNNLKKYIYIFVYNLVMKTEDTFHWHIYICSSLCKRLQYSFIRQHQFENFVFVMSPQTDVQYSFSSFFMTWPFFIAILHTKFHEQQV